MIKIETDGKETRMDAQGSVADLINDTLHILSAILAGMKKTPVPKKEVDKICLIWKAAIAKHMAEIDNHAKDDNVAFAEVTEAGNTLFSGKLKDF